MSNDCNKAEYNRRNGHATTAITLNKRALSFRLTNTPSSQLAVSGEKPNDNTESDKQGHWQPLSICHQANRPPAVKDQMPAGVATQSSEKSDKLICE